MTELARDYLDRVMTFDGSALKRHVRAERREKERYYASVGWGGLQREMRIFRRRMVQIYLRQREAR